MHKSTSIRCPDVPQFNQIGQPRWNSPLIRFFGMKVGSAAAPTLAPEIAPSFDVNQRDDASLAFLRGEKLASYGQTISAAPGFYSTAALRNPDGSGVLLEVERILANSTNVVTVSISDVDDLVSSGYCTPLDSRWGRPATVQTSARYTYRNNSAGALSGQRILIIPAGQVGLIEVPVLLVPDTALVIETSSVNQNLTFGFVFRERAIPAEELSTG